jgi:hypothetical protein
VRRVPRQGTPPVGRPGMVAKCLEPGCPVRFLKGRDGWCKLHAGDDALELAAAAKRLGIDLTKRDDVTVSSPQRQAWEE